MLFIISFDDCKKCHELIKSCRNSFPGVLQDIVGLVWYSVCNTDTTRKEASSWPCIRNIKVHHAVLHAWIRASSCEDSSPVTSVEHCFLPEGCTTKEISGLSSSVELKVHLVSWRWLFSLFSLLIWLDHSGPALELFMFSYLMHSSEKKQQLLLTFVLMISQTANLDWNMQMLSGRTLKVDIGHCNRIQRAAFAPNTSDC